MQGNHIGPQTGRPVSVRSGYLKLTTGPHLILYRKEADRVVIIRILHGRMDVERHL